MHSDLDAPDGNDTAPRPVVSVSDLSDGPIPVHVACVMDGNGRWAARRGLPRTEGHAAGEAALLDAVEGALDLGIPWITMYAFSTENWRRPADEVRYLMGFNESLLMRRRDELHIVAACADDQARLVPPGMLLQIPSRKPSWRVDLAAVRAAGGDYLATLSANTRQQIRRALRLYEQAGPLTATRATDATTGLAFLDALAVLHQRQWQTRGEPGGFAFPFFERFQRRLVETGVPGGTVELLRVSRGDEPIGYLLNLVYRGHVLGFVSGFRFEDDPRLKPGLVCHALAIARHAAEGAAVYDFLAGAARYKANLGQPGPEFVYLLIQRPTVMTRAERQLRRAWTGLRPVLRRLGIRR